MSHPHAMKLDALAAGDVDAAVEAHVAECAACAAYVAKLSEGAAEFHAMASPDAFAERVAARAKRTSTRARFTSVRWIAPPALALAAAVTLFLRSGAGPLPLDPGAETAVAPGTHFKGGLSVVAIRERAGVQERLSGPFEVAPFDRLRIEVAIDRDEPVTAGLLSNDGNWAPLLAPTELTAGTHFSELAARFDQTPTDAILLVGSPDDVTRARSTGRFEGVVAWRVRSESKE